jgi:uncharacterized protein YceK
MKKLYLLIFAAIACSVVVAQIPNSGFENWTSAGAYEDPDGWATMNFISVPNGHTSCQKSTDSHSGTYSLKVTNNTSLGQMQGGWGIVATRGFDFPFKPAFAVTGHPTTVGGWYKYTALGGDSGLVMTVLFYQGAVVASSTYPLTDNSNWTQFSYDLEPYTNADSATIILFAFRTNGPNDPPNGNSTLWVDDISIGNTTGVESVGVLSGIQVFPNPAHNKVIVNNVQPGTQVVVYNMLGEIVSAEITQETTHVLNVSDMPKGLYLIQSRKGTAINTQRLVLE